MRRTAAMITAITARTQIGHPCSDVNLSQVPTILPWCNSRGDLSANWPAMSGRPLVIVGTPNHRNALPITPTYSIQRIDGNLRHTQIAYRPANGHTSGRPSAVSASSHHVHA